MDECSRGRDGAEERRCRGFLEAAECSCHTHCCMLTCMHSIASTTKTASDMELAKQLWKQGEELIQNALRPGN